MELNRAARLALWLHELTLSAAERDPIVGDLLEEFELRAADDLAPGDAVALEADAALGGAQHPPPIERRSHDAGQ